MAKTAAEKAANYDGLYPNSLPPERFDQKVERMERIETKERKRSGGRGMRYFTVPELPWHRED